MRRPLSIAAVAILALASTPLAGCFVLDELEAGEKIMDQHSPVDAPSKKAKADAAGKSEGEESEPAGQAWWSQARSLNTGPAAEDADGDDPAAVVRCELGGSTRFMRRGDCLSQGGRPSSR